MKPFTQKNILISIGIVLSGFAIAGAVTVAAQTDGAPSDAAIQASGIAYPVAELGGCTDKNACKSYCEDPAHLDACIAFAKKQGLMSKDEATRAEKFAKQVRSSEGGPGGCRTPQECRAYCENIANLESCVSFAEKQGATDTNVTEGKKILTFIKKGGSTPGGCTSKESCEKYCGDFSHAEECFNFAKGAGIAQGRGEGRGGGPQTTEQIQQFVTLTKSGQTPGGCTSKESCESYCRNENNFDECVSFGQKLGFIKTEDVTKIKENRGKGPGGCTSAESCSAFCNDPGNQQACFAYAEDRGLISKEQSQQTKEGFIRVRSGIENAPPEVAACLKATVGGTVIDDIQSGKLVPGPEIGERMRGCFEKFGERHDSRAVFQNAPKEIVSCVKEKVGTAFDAVSAGKAEASPAIADAFRVCGQEQKLFGGGDGQGQPFNGAENRPFGEISGENGGPSGVQKQTSEMLLNFVRTAPQGVATCIQEKIGGDLETLKTGNAPQNTETLSKARECFQSFKPQESSVRQFRGGEFEAFQKKEGQFPVVNNASQFPLQPFDGKGGVPASGVRPQFPGEGFEGKEGQKGFLNEEMRKSIPIQGNTPQPSFDKQPPDVFLKNVMSGKQSPEMLREMQQKFLDSSSNQGKEDGDFRKSFLFPNEADTKSQGTQFPRAVPGSAVRPEGQQLFLGEQGKPFNSQSLGGTFQGQPGERMTQPQGYQGFPGVTQQGFDRQTNPPVPFNTNQGQQGYQNSEQRPLGEPFNTQQFGSPSGGFSPQNIPPQNSFQQPQNFQQGQPSGNNFQQPPQGGSFNPPPGGVPGGGTPPPPPQSRAAGSFFGGVLSLIQGILSQ